MTEPVLKPVWQMHDVRAERDVLAFWREGKLLSQDVDIKTRLNELCVIAYDDNRVVAVNTVVLQRLERVRARIAMIRLAVAADYRNRRLASQITDMARLLLEEWAARHPQEKVMGMGCVLQTRALGAKANQAVWPRNGLALIDHAPNGDQVRLVWFANATIDESL